MAYLLNKSDINTLEIHKNLPLLNKYNLCYITDFEIGEKEITEKHWFKGNTTKKVKVLSKYVVSVFNRKEKYVGVFQGEDAIDWLPVSAIRDFDGSIVQDGIYECRKHYLCVKEGLEGFGHKLISDEEQRKEKLKRINKYQ